MFRNAPSELLINHVNYFDGKGLKNLLTEMGFDQVEYYTYGLKTTFRGQGWKENPKLMSPVSKKRKADEYIKANKLAGSNEFRKDEILDKWYIRTNAKWITFLYCLFHHFSVFRIAPERNIGHEIYGLFRKSK
jgi:hypothetical protein